MLSLLLLAAVVVRVDPPASPLQGDAGRRTRGTESRGVAPSANLPARYFGICDRDGDRSISYPEASASLNLDRKAFSVYDTDGDGLISMSEFRKRYKDILSAGGTFPPPKAKVVPPSALPATADKVLESFDRSRDGALDLAELDAALVGMGSSKLDPEMALAQLDHDGSARLEAEEIEELLALLRSGSARKGGPRAQSIRDLFGTVVSRKTSPASTPEPPRIVGPVPSFLRLDLDGDGRVTRDELGELQRPYTLAVQTNAVLAALDQDGDGAISEAEFWSSMGAAR